MSLHHRPLWSFIATATIAAAVTTLVGWPSQVNADGKAKAAARQQSKLAVAAGAPQNAPLAKNEAKLGDLVISAELAPSDTTTAGRVVHLECRNPTAQRISGNVEIELTRTRGLAMERVMPQPQIAWRHPESVSVEPGETLIRDVPLPKNIGKEVARIDEARERAENSDSVPSPSTYYGVTATPLDASGARPKARVMAPSKPSLTLASRSNSFGF
jgi:hypothetical protein